MTSLGHGHVRPNPDGTKAKCGGPALCLQCANELRGVQTGRWKLNLIPDPIPGEPMTDAALKSALAAAEAELPDGYFAILLVGPIPEFGQTHPKACEVATSAGAEQTKEIIVGLARSIEKGSSGEARQVATE